MCLKAYITKTGPQLTIADGVYLPVKVGHRMKAFQPSVSAYNSSHLAIAACVLLLLSLNLIRS